ncbi:Maf protein [Trifolium repens]|nr:Maf protein [Trifolium repens]
MEPTTTSPPYKIILGSSSVARRKILSQMGYQFTLMSADIDEKSIRKDTPEELVMALAEAKADAIISKLQTTSNQERVDEPTLLIAADTAEAILQRLPVGDYLKDAEPTLLITSDQVVVYEGVIREKPSSKEEARQFLKDYSGRKAATVDQIAWIFISMKYQMKSLRSWLTRELLSVAGGLIIEHPLIFPYVKEVVGTTDSVMGLPKDLTEKLLKEVL